MDRTQKVNKNWESYSDDDSSLEEDLELSLDGNDNQDASRPGMPKRAMAEDKLQEKRLKERARRNGMASSIDEMRLLVPELIEAKKNYSQAKVVAFALAHIYELQRENDTLRERLGMPNRMDEFRARVKANGKTKKERAPAGERGRKRRRLNEDAAVAVAISGAAPLPASASVPSTPTVAPPAPFAHNGSMPRPAPVAAASVSAVAVPVKLALSRDESEAHAEHDFVTDSLAASPALSPHALDDELGPFASGFESHFEQPRSHGMDWEAAHDDLFAHDLFSPAAKTSASASSNLAFDSFFVDHLLTNTASLQ